MSRIFISHSSANTAEAVALRDWLEREGWTDEVFLDLDPKRGIAAGERWERSLNEAASRCEAVLFLVSRAWIASGWCRRELGLGRRLNKRLFGVVIEDLRVDEVPQDLADEWQLVRLAAGRDHVMLRAIIPITHEEAHVSFSAEGLMRLKHGLEQAGLNAKHFPWPPENDQSRPPYRGLRPLEADDAGIFFGRDAPVIEALDRLRGLREAARPRLLVILGASGAGKSSFLRAGLFPRLVRDDRHFLPLPIIRPERAAVTGETGLVCALEGAFQAADIPMARADLRSAIDGGPVKLRPLLEALVEKATQAVLDAEGMPRPPTLILSIDQGEELFLAEGHDEAHVVLAVLRCLLAEDAPDIVALFTIRSDNYEQLQNAKELEGVRQQTLSLPPMPKGSYAEVIKGPARRLEGTARALRIEDSLVDALLGDIEAGGAKDALPLLAFTLERLFREHGGDGNLKLSEYEQLGRVRGSIEAAVEQAFKAADADPRIPRAREARLALLRRGLIPWLAGIDPDTGLPRRRIARLSEIPSEARPLIDHLVEQRLLATDIAKDTREKTIEPTHDALLRQWGLLQGWLKADLGLLTVLDGIKRAARDWAANGKTTHWLTHFAERLRSAERLLSRPDLAANLEPTDKAYVSACQTAERKARARTQRGVALVGVLALLLAFSGLAWWKQDQLVTLYHWRMVMRPTLLTTAEEKKEAAQPGSNFQECANGCPKMVVVPAGTFVMGSPDNIGEAREHPSHSVAISRPFAVGAYELTFEEWDHCAAARGCRSQVSSSGSGRGRQPVINVSWKDAQQYAAWLSKMTGHTYRLLTESEWEYAARAMKPTLFSFGNDDALLPQYGWFSANADHQAHPVGEKKPNAFKLFDMHGNVSEWVEDCDTDNYQNAPQDGAAMPSENCRRRVCRGGSWLYGAKTLRSASRDWFYFDKGSDRIGVRLARTLSP